MIDPLLADAKQYVWGLIESIKITGICEPGIMAVINNDFSSWSHHALVIMLFQYNFPHALSIIIVMMQPLLPLKCGPLGGNRLNLYRVFLAKPSVTRPA